MKSDPHADHSGLPSLLLVDDRQEILEQMKWGLKSAYMIYEADHRAAAVDILQREKISLVTLDLGLPPDAGGVTEGLSALEQLLAVNPLVKVVVITGNQDRANALKAIQLGAYDFMEKPVDLEVLRVVLQRAGYLAGLEKENQKLLDRSANNAGETGRSRSIHTKHVDGKLHQQNLKPDIPAGYFCVVHHDKKIALETPFIQSLPRQ